MNLGILAGLGFGYVLFDKNGQKIFRKSMDKLSEASSKIFKTLDKEANDDEVSESD